MAIAHPPSSQGSDDATRAVPKIVSIFERLPSKLLDRFSAEGRIELVNAPPGLSFAELDEWLLTNLTGASAAIVCPMAGKFGMPHIAAAQAGGVFDRFKIVSTYSVGTETVDKLACKQAGIKVGYTPYVGDDCIAEYTIAMLLHFCRKMAFLTDTVMKNQFPQAMKDNVKDPTINCGFSPSGKTVCFFGFGRIAQKTAEKLLAFGVRKILYTTSKPHPFNAHSFPRLHALQQAFYPESTIENEPDLPTLTSQADILVILCPGNPSTNGVINSSIFQKMKSTSVLINVARGTVVVNDDLVTALKENRIAAALLDVVQGEPNIYTDHPLLAPELKDKVLILPHAASAVVETRSIMCDITARNILTTLGFDNDLLGDKVRLMQQQAWTHFVE
ncbi:related to glyoxylate/hydroxypyruvate reductase [Melanopsichium pennsylvanicum]|uniref:Related to glyoxylate/hydroxypyruvate reductase n=2 Tax=Melanopsichium pennsylvanicum TaxID=63383 RepID=A0AAJ4XR61_9BASI|nr:related to glyoxylate/hydroxypyruvate reductase [Melanopsichium pennsylvanicum 4]SNX86411.1 related to glyoxylate/hydroxypyruvate reductase [Melanopsichium pennsylvanicum]